MLGCPAPSHPLSAKAEPQAQHRPTTSAVWCLVAALWTWFGVSVRHALASLLQGSWLLAYVVCSTCRGKLSGAEAAHLLQRHTALHSLATVMWNTQELQTHGRQGERVTSDHPKSMSVPPGGAWWSPPACTVLKSLTFDALGTEAAARVAGVVLAYCPQLELCRTDKLVSPANGQGSCITPPGNSQCQAVTTLVPVR